MNAPGGKDPDRPGPGGAALEGDDAGEEMGGRRRGRADGGGGPVRHARRQDERGGFDIMRTPCGPLGRSACS